VSYEAESENGRRLRRIADHLRACTFAIHENVYPGPNKEKYVVKRLLRRAVLDGHQMGVREPFLHKLVDRVAEVMKSAYPELGETAGRVSQVIEKEEASFLGTLDAGLERIERIFGQMRREGRGVVSGRDAFDMYQTHGFPPELFETMAAEHNLTFDWKGYASEMERHGEVSGTGEKIVFKHDPLEGLKKAMHGSRFLGYEKTEVNDAKVVGIIAGDTLCDKVDEVDHRALIVVVLDRTPFYGEKGGQVGDRGELVGPAFHFEVTDTQVDGAFTLHRGHLREGTIALGDVVTARVDANRRQGIRRAHSATHILHHALRELVGRHAEQQGSKVDDDVLRFDFTNPSALSVEQLDQIEFEVNSRLTDGEPIRWQEVPLSEARSLGAVMLFGEKYSDVVRVVSVGDFSKELCGGTHLDNSGQVGLFKIIAEESVAAGTRRITALTGPAALRHVQKTEAALAKAAAVLKVPPGEVPSRAESLVAEIRRLKKQAATGGVEQAFSADQLLSGAEEVAGTKIVVAEVPGAGPQTLRQLIDQLRRKGSPVAVLLASRQDDEKVMLVAGISRELVAKGCDAVQWVRAAASAVGGSGGGRADMAQAGGRDAAKLPEAFEAARAMIRDALGQ
jgi:alanyl-tRNA synthetase